MLYQIKSELPFRQCCVVIAVLYQTKAKLAEKQYAKQRILAEHFPDLLCFLNGYVQ